jgi:hypothetical protein
MTPRRVILALGIAAGLAGWLWWTSARARRAGSKLVTPTVTRPVLPTSPYMNTRAGVKYVGDAVCARCHQEISKTYNSHPMGRSLGTVDEASPSRPHVPDTGVTFEQHGFTYEVQQRGERVVHKETRRDASGRVLSEVEAEIAYALGSGTRGVSYLFERDGSLFQSPIS